MLLAAFSIISVLGAIGSTAHLLVNYRQPTAAVAWLFAVWTIPWLGTILYVMFAVYEGPRSLRRRRSLSQKLRAATSRGNVSGNAVREERDLTASDRVCDRLDAIPITRGNQITLHESPDVARADLLDAIREAEHEILLETYIWTPDSFTDEVAELLAQKQREGVEVRVLLDAIGIRTTRGHNAKKLQGLGIPFETFLAPNPLKGRFQINFRNHRKLLVVDSAVAITGGRNYAEDYFDESEDGIRDMSVRIAGPAVGVLRGLFIEDWIVASEIEDQEAIEFDVPEPTGDTDVRVIPHGCDESCDVYIPLLSSTLRAARDTITLVTPYFAPGPAMLHDLRVASLSGVRVRILVPEKTPEKWPEVAARRFIDTAIRAGIEVYVRPRPFIHAKAIVIDNEMAFIGSANFDQRSFYLNYELTCQVLDPDFARSVTDYFAPDFGVSKRLEPEEFLNRGWKQRAIENAAALFSPIL